ncbi:YigZ family protein [bacterium]|nr:YigZ family protein [bacterium]
MALPEEQGWYWTVEREGRAEIREWGSRFLGYALSTDDPDSLKDRVHQLRLEHPQATHVCSASRIGVLRPESRSSDDGEPAHTAGDPILQAIRSSDCYNVWIGVVRYYGGTKLGRPGLIQAYRETAALALTDAGRKRVDLVQHFCLSLPYDDEHSVYRLAQRKGLKVQSKETNRGHALILHVPLLQSDAIRAELAPMLSKANWELTIAVP